jgi:flagellar operon protein
MPDPIRHNPAITPPGVGRTGPTATPRPAVGGNSPVPFDKLLCKQMQQVGPAQQDVRLSGHAVQRLAQRGIQFDQAMSDRLTSGVDAAAAKGSRDALVMVDGTAFVVSVPNRTVITAVDPASMKDKVFTNIDSAVIS